MHRPRVFMVFLLLLLLISVVVFKVLSVRLSSYSVSLFSYLIRLIVLRLVLLLSVFLSLHLLIFQRRNLMRKRVKSRFNYTPAIDARIEAIFERHFGRIIVHVMPNFSYDHLRPLEVEIKEFVRAL